MLLMMMESRWWNKERINILLPSGCIICLEKEHCWLCCHIWVPSTLILKINHSQQYKQKEDNDDDDNDHENDDSNNDNKIYSKKMIQNTASYSQS